MNTVASAFCCSFELIWCVPHEYCVTAGRRELNAMPDDDVQRQKAVPEWLDVHDGQVLPPGRV